MSFVRLSHPYRVTTDKLTGCQAIVRAQHKGSKAGYEKRGNNGSLQTDRERARQKGHGGGQGAAFRAGGLWGQGVRRGANPWRCGACFKQHFTGPCGTVKSQHNTSGQTGEMRYQMGVFKKQTEADKQAAREAVETRRRARQLARGGNATGDVLVRCVAGLRVYGKRLAENGDPKGGAAIEKQADAAAALLADVEALLEQIAQPKTDHVDDAVASAAVELQKKLPCCFPSAADAVAFASRLPLIEARRAASLAIDAGAKLSRRAGELRHEAQAVIEAAALVAMGGHDDAKAIKALVAMA